MTEDDTDVRGWLESVEAPHARLDLSEIVQIGRAQVRRRRQLAAGGSAAVALAVTAAVPVAVRVLPGPSEPYVAADQYPALDCTVTELATPDLEIDLDWVEVVAMDPTGRYIVGNQLNVVTDGATGGEIERQAAVILWDNGDPAELTDLRDSAQAVDVNADGVVVGIGWDDLDGGWVYRDGELSPLAEPPGYSTSRVSGLNQAGDIAGTVVSQDGGNDPDYVAESVVVWPAADPDEPRVLTEPAGKDVANIAGITDTGMVVGWLHGEPDEPSPFLPYAWELDGTGHYLPLPDGAVGGQAIQVEGDWAAGSVDMLVPEESVREPSPASPTAEPMSPSPGAADPSPTADGLVLVTVPARWNLLAGTAEVIDTGQPPERENATYVTAVAADGDVALNQGVQGLVLRDGEWFSIPGYDGGASYPGAINEDGTLIAGSTGGTPNGTEPPANTWPVAWHC